jgi:hypothetical protein
VQDKMSREWSAALSPIGVAGIAMLGLSLRSRVASLNGGCSEA